MASIDSIDWEISQLVKTQLFTDKQAVLRSALRALFQNQPTLKLQMVIRAYMTGDISVLAKRRYSWEFLMQKWKKFL